MTETLKATDPRTAAPNTTPAPVTSGPGPTVSELITHITAGAAPVFAAMGWAEDEIAVATGRHRERADILYHSFAVLVPRDVGPGMGTEFVYRGHARELLERIAAGADPRPATAAEICLALVDTSLRAPLHGPAAGLYLRMWMAAFPAHPLTAEHADHQIHYQQLYGARMDELEVILRRALRDPDRQLGDISCSGWHHGEPVSCAFAPPSTLAAANPDAATHRAPPEAVARQTRA